MGASDESSFFVYSVGERPDALTLGSLVLEKYWQPLVARNYIHKPLSEEALQEHAYVSKVDNIVFHGSSRNSPSVSVNGGDILNLSLAYNKDLERVVVAEKGTRMILKNPEEFLTAIVLKNPAAQKKLKLWLSAAFSSYVLEWKFARRPKVWFLTGLYLLENARTFVSRGQTVDKSAGVSSAVVGASSGVHVGGSASLGVGSSRGIEMEITEPHVWAAQFRLLDARFIKMGKSGVNGVTLPMTMGLYRDCLSLSTVRGGDGRWIELDLEREEGGNGKETFVDKKDSEKLEKYEERLEDAIKQFEKVPKHLLQ